MTREDIIRMAREAGLPIFDAKAIADDPVQQSMADIVTKVWHDSAERFAYLIAKAENEACARLCDIEANDWGYDADVIDVAIEIRERYKQ